MAKAIINLEEMGDGLGMVRIVRITGEKAGFVLGEE
jgi:hypothetical protein